MKNNWENEYVYQTSKKASSKVQEQESEAHHLGPKSN